MNKLIILVLLALAISLMAAEIVDPLVGSSTGIVNGGTFTAAGWKTIYNTDAVEWQIPTAPNGKVSFDVTGLYASNSVFPNLDKNGDEDMHYTLFNMYDRDPNNVWYGQWMPEANVRQWHNPYKAICHLFGYVQGDQWKWGHGRFRLNVSAYQGGYDDDPHAFEIEYGTIDWQRDRTYHIELHWGDGHMDYFVDGQKIASCDYSDFGADYAPPFHALRLGSSLGCKGFGHQVPIGITFSNFRFERVLDETSPKLVRFSPDGETAALDEYIVAVYDEAIKEFSPSIQPTVAGEFRLVGNSIVFEADDLMQPFTRYTIRLDDVADAAGNVADPVEMTFETFGQYTPTVQKYGIFEYVSTIRPEPVTFHGPSRSITIQPFDDGNWYKVRMAPTEPGTWTFELFGKTEQFECTPSNLYHIRRSKANPYTFETTSGHPWAWKGETSWRAFTSLLPLESRYKTYIDLRFQQGYNAVQSIVVSYINGDAFWANEGGTAFELTSAGKNYDKPNPHYYRWIDRRIEYANSKGMVPVIFITWAQEFVKFSDEQFLSFTEQLAARWSAYNIIWCLSGEYNEVYSENNLSPEIWKNMGSHLYKTDPYKHLISLHPSGRGSSREFAGQPWFGFIMQQWPINYSQHITEDRQYNLPVVNAEYAYADYHDNDDVRTGAWDIFTAGGFYTAGFFHTFAPDKGGWDLMANEAEQRALQITNEFIDSIPWWTMRPDLTVNGSQRLSNGTETVIWNKKGSDGALPVGDAIYIDTKTGEPANTAAEHIMYAFPKDDVPPDAVTGLEIVELK